MGIIVVVVVAYLSVVVVVVAKRSALDETHGPDWPLPRDLRHGWELHS